MGVKYIIPEIPETGTISQNRTIYKMSAGTILEKLSNCPVCNQPLKLKHFRVGFTHIDRLPEENSTQHTLECICTNEICEIEDYEIIVLSKEK